MAEAKKKIIDIIMHLSGKHAPYNIFSDWIEMCSISIQNTVTMVHGKVWKDREQRYIDVARQYTEEELERFAEMFVLLGDALTEELTDVLGEIYMETGMGNKYTGQFFTPFHLSELCARLDIDPERLAAEDRISLHEPACGGGGMVIAACKALHDAGFDYQRNLDVVAQDLDWKGCYMTYLQLSLIGCRALVVQGDTLTEPFDRRKTDPARILITPAKAGALL